DVGTRTRGSDSTGVMPGTEPRNVTAVAVPTATTRSSRPNAFQAWVRARPSGERGSPAATRTSASAAVAMSPQPGEGECQELLMRQSPTCNIDIPASHGAAFRITASKSPGARLRHSCFRSFTSAARNVPRKESAVTSNAGSSFLAEVLEYKAITARSEEHTSEL